MKLTGTDRRTDRQTDGKDHILSQADVLTKKMRKKGFPPYFMLSRLGHIFNSNCETFPIPNGILFISPGNSFTFLQGNGFFSQWKVISNLPGYLSYSYLEKFPIPSDKYFQAQHGNPFLTTGNQLP